MKRRVHLTLALAVAAFAPAVSALPVAKSELAPQPGPKPGFNLRKKFATPAPSSSPAPSSRPAPSSAPAPTASAPPTATAAPTATGTAPSTSGTASATQAPIDGVYTIAGSGDGSRYTGTATISKVGGIIYDVVWTIGTKTWYGTAIRDGDVLAAAWSLTPTDANVFDYIVRRDGLDGVWLERGDTKLGSEYLTAGTGLPRDLLGRYTIARGTNPDGSKYTGTCLVGPGASPGFLTLTWTIGGTSMKGLGIRTTQTATSDIVTAGFSNSGTNFGVTQYMIDATGKTLTGRWAQAINPASISTGTETLSRP